jgi:precorrin-6B methylase 2
LSSDIAAGTPATAPNTIGDVLNLLTINLLTLTLRSRFFILEQGEIFMKTCSRIAMLVIALMVGIPVSFMLSGVAGHARNLDVPFVPTPYDIVAAMLDAADVGPGDYVIDLGSGDGRIVIAAAQRGAFGHGIDLNPVRVDEAETNAEESGVSDRVMFLEGDLFEADIRSASVVTMYLLHSVNLRLKPILFEQLEPGTRIVSYAFKMGNWQADEHLRVGNRDVYYWVIPADVAGMWEWRGNGDTWEMNVEQAFQEISVELTAGGRELRVQDPVVNGRRVSFMAEDPERGDRYVFSGHVNEDAITGTMQTRGGQVREIGNWNAVRR